MIRVAITGGISSGKSTVSKLFKELGIPIFNSDLVARNAEKLPYIQRGFKDILGDDIFVDGVLDRPRMRGIVFTDKEKLKAVNALMGPYNKTMFEKFVYKHSRATYVMLESAILFESDAQRNFDFIITVTANEELRIKRAMKRDNSTLEEVQNKINNQWSEKAKIALSTFIVINDGEDLIDSLEVLEIQVRTIHKAILLEEISSRFSKLNNFIEISY